MGSLFGDIRIFFVAIGGILVYNATNNIFADIKENFNMSDKCCCGHDHEEDMEMEVITLTLDDDSELECAVLGIFDVDEKNYIAL